MKYIKQKWLVVLNWGIPTLCLCGAIGYILLAYQNQQNLNWLAENIEQVERITNGEIANLNLKKPLH